MLRILYYLCKKSGKISAKKGGGLILHHGRTLHVLRYILGVKDRLVTAIPSPYLAMLYLVFLHACIFSMLSLVLHACILLSSSGT